jgi:hypothetical protein
MHTHTFFIHQIYVFLVGGISMSHMWLFPGGAIRYVISDLLLIKHMILKISHESDLKIHYFTDFCCLLV